MWATRLIRRLAARRGRRGGEDLGRLGESLACKLLKRRGMKILARNYRCPAGEVDVIALARRRRSPGAETLVFVEVKTRSSDRYTAPESAVDAAKRRRMSRVADYYRAARRAEDLPARFDIVSVVIPPDGAAPRIDHIADAF